MNAVDRDEAGDYYVSGRNSWVVVKIAGLKSAFGPPGTVIWKLGGADNQFTLGFGVAFSFQHHLRVLEVGPEITVISIFDNSFDGFAYPKTSPWSTGKVISLNTKTMTANILEYYTSPAFLLSGFAGSCQARLPGTNNTFMGWGLVPAISEHAQGSPGELLFYATFGDAHELESYRNWKAPWKGYPTTRPKVFAYRETCNSDLIVYMSWNGATEVKGWRVLAADGLEDKVVEVGKSVWAKMGFETMANVGVPNGPRTFISVQALDENEAVLEISKPVRVFVPSAGFAQQYACNSTRCNTFDQYAVQWSVADSC